MGKGVQRDAVEEADVRIRALKPEFWKSETVAKVSIPARLLFTGLWGLADSWGVLEDRPRRIRIELFPYDDLVAEQVVAWLDELVAARLVVRYQGGDGVALLWLPGLRRHQIASMPKEERKRPPKFPLPTGVTPDDIDAGVASVSIIKPDDSSVAQPPHRQGGATQSPQRVMGDGYTGDGRAGVREHTAAPPRAASPPLDASDPVARWPFERLEPWARALRAVPGLRHFDSENWPTWKTVVDRFGAEAVVAAANTIDPKVRYADRVLSHLIENAPPPPPEPEAPPDPDTVIGHALIAEHGWQRCLALLRIPNVPDEATLRHAIALNPALGRDLAKRVNAAGKAGAA
jgi:hypothetical protein